MNFEAVPTSVFAEPEGFVELVLEGRNGRIVGTQVPGVNAVQLIALLALAVRAGLGAVALAQVGVRNRIPHPAISDGISKADHAKPA